jgi:hypothetical protein
MTTEDLIRISTDHYDAIVESYAVTPKEHEVRMLSIAGQPDAIKALRAAMSIGLTVEITGLGPIRWPKHATTYFTCVQKRLPCGAVAVLWLPQLGTSIGIQHDTNAYLLQRQHTPGTPPLNFVAILDRVLACPILADWAAPLWAAAQDHQWVRPLQTYNCVAWEFIPHTDDIIKWIQQYLQSSTPAPPKVAA